MYHRKEKVLIICLEKSYVFTFSIFKIKLLFSDFVKDQNCVRLMKSKKQPTVTSKEHIVNIGSIKKFTTIKKIVNNLLINHKLNFITFNSLELINFMIMQPMGSFSLIPSLKKLRIREGTRLIYFIIRCINLLVVCYIMEETIP